MISYFTYLSFSSLFVFFFLCSAAHRDLHSFPTRRSSDLSLAICAPTLAQHAALSCFEPEVMQIYEKRRLSFKQRRDYLIPALEQLGLKVPVHPDGAFYIYADIREHSDNSLEFAHKLLNEAGVAAVPGHDFGPAHAQHGLRFSYATGLDRLQEAVERMQAFLA